MVHATAASSVTGFTEANAGRTGTGNQTMTPLTEGYFALFALFAFGWLVTRKK